MNSITQFVKTDLSFTRADHTIHNLNTLNLPENSPHLRVLWMYPDSLPLHGGRGDLMALLRFATALELPVEIHRINNLTDPVPLDEADMLYFCSGDLTSMPDIAAALLPIVSQLAEFGAQGKMILANGSTYSARRSRPAGSPRNSSLYTSSDHIPFRFSLFRP